MEEVILVDENDQELGIMDKMKAHRHGLLHRAFSIVLFNNQGKILLQQRALNKYHSAGLWTNTCCSHPRPGEPILVSVNRRLQQEMGIHTRVDFLYKFIYKAELEHGLIEHEYDHVFVGLFNGQPVLNPDEVQDFKFSSPQAIIKDIEDFPETYTEWFKLMIGHPDLSNLLANGLSSSSR